MLEVIAGRQKPHPPDEPIWSLADDVPLWVLVALYRDNVRWLRQLVLFTATVILRIPGMKGEAGKEVITPAEVARIEQGLAKFGQSLWEPTRAQS